jgi:cystathionine gamma-synthase
MVGSIADQPTLYCVDIARARAACRARGVLSASTTFASPINQQPLTLGVDLACRASPNNLNGATSPADGHGPKALVAPIEKARRQSAP